MLPLNQTKGVGMNDYKYQKSVKQRCEFIKDQNMLGIERSIRHEKTYTVLDNNKVLARGLRIEECAVRYGRSLFLYTVKPE